MNNENFLALKGPKLQIANQIMDSKPPQGANARTVQYAKMDRLQQE